jgi:hypothetical protein
MTLAIVNSIGQAIVDKIKRNIQAGVDVDDIAFAPLKDNSGDIPLNKTQQLLRSITYRVETTSKGFELILMFGTLYGTFHITGTRKMVSRPFLPRNNQIPASWLRIIEEESAGLLQVTSHRNLIR